MFLFLKSIWGGPEPDPEPVSDPAQSQCRIQLGASVGSCSEPVSDLEPQFLLLNLLPAVLPNYFRFNQKPVILYWDSGKKKIFSSSLNFSLFEMCFLVIYFSSAVFSHKY